MLTVCKAFAKYKGKSVTVPWSGGLDSTCMLIAMAHAGATVTAVTIVAENMPNPRHEEFARGRMIKAIKNSELSDSITFTTHGFPMVEANRAWPNIYRWNQKQLWVSLLPFFIPRKTEVVAIGAVGDDTTVMLDDLKRQWKACAWNIKDSVKQATLEFPMVKLLKYDIAEYVKRLCDTYGIRDVFNNITYCEQTTKIGNTLFACGGCPSCLAAKDAGISTLQPKAVKYSNEEDLSDIFSTVLKENGTVPFKVKESEKVYSFYLALYAEHGDGNEFFYRASKRIQIDRDVTCVIYLGTNTSKIHAGLDYEDKDKLPDDYIVLNKDEHDVRILDYLSANGFTGADFSKYLNDLHKDKE